MGNDLVIKIKGSLNEALTKTEIQSQLDKIGKELSITIGTTKQQVTEISNQVKKISTKASPSVMLDGKKVLQASEATGKLVKSLDEAINKYKKLGTVTSKKIFDTQTGELKGFNLEIQKANGLIEKLKFDLVTIQDGKKFDDMFMLTRMTEIDNTRLQMQKALQQTIIKRQKEEQKLNQIQSKAINENLEKQRKLQEQYVGTSSSLKGLTNATQEHIVEVLRQNQVIGEQEVLGASLNKTTGEWGITVKQNSKEVRVLKGTIDETNGSLYKHTDIIKQASATNLGFIEQLKIALTRVPVWMAAMTAFYGTLRTLENTVEVITEVDTALTELQKVMNSTDTTVFTRMLDSAIEKAKELGQTVTDVLASYTQAARSGLRDEDLQALSESSLIGSNIGDGITAEETANYLISAIEQMNLSYQDSIKLIDSWNNLANNNATTMSDLMEGWSKSASTVRNFGGDVHELNAAIGSLNQVLKQSGSEIGNFLKSAAPRILSSDVQNTLESLGISVKNANGEIKSFFEIYREVAKALDEGRMTAEQFNEAALALGGRYHITRVQALIEAMRELNGEQSLYDKMLNESINSAGSAIQENLIYMNSIEAQQRKLIATAQELALTAGDASITSLYRELLDILTSLAEAGTGFINRFGLLPPLFGTLASVILLFNKNLLKTSTYSKLAGDANAYLQLKFESLAGSVNRAKAAIQAQTVGLTGLTKVTKGASFALGTLISSLKGFVISTGIGLGFVALSTLIGKLIEKFAEAREEQRELEQQTAQLVSNYEIHKNEINNLIEEYKELHSISQRSAEQEERYIEISNRLAELMPSIVKYKDEEGNARLKNVEAIEKEIASLEKLSTAEANTFIKNFSDEVEKVRNDIKSTQGEIDKLYKQQARQNGITPRGRGVRPTARADELTDPELRSKEIMLLREQQAEQEELNQLYIQFGNAILKREGLTEKLTEAQEKYIQTILDEKGYTQEAQEAIELYAGDIAQLVSEYEQLSNTDAGWIAQQISESKIARDEIDKYANKLIYLKEILGEGFDISGISFDQLNVIEDIINKVQNGGTAWREYSNTLKEAGINIDNISQILGSLRNSNEDVTITAKKLGVQATELIPVYNEFGEIISFANQQLSEQSEELDSVSNEVDQLTESYNNSISNIQTLNEILNELNENHELSVDKIGVLLEKYPQLLQYLGNETELREAIQEEIKNEAIISQQAILEKIKDNEVFFNEVIKGNAEFFNRLKEYYGIDLKNHKSLAQAKLAIEQQTINSMAKGWQKYFRVTGEGMIALSESARKIIDPRGDGTLSADSFSLSLMQKAYEANQTIKKIISDLDSITLDTIGLSIDKISSIGLDTPSSSRSKSSSSTSSSKSSNSTILDNINKQIEYYTRKKELLEDDIALQEYYMSLVDESSQKYRDYLEKIADLTRKQAKYINDAQWYAQYQLDNNKKLSEEERKELEKTIISLNDTRLDLLSKVNDLYYSITQSKKGEFDNLISGVDRYLQKINYQLETVEEHSLEYNRLLQEQIKQYKYKQELLHKEAEYLREQIKSGKLNAQQVEELKVQVSELSIEWWNIESQIKSVNQTLNEVNKNLADNIIETLKSAYEKRRDMARAQYEYELDLLEKAYEKQIELYEEDLEKYEETINKKLDLLEKQKDAEDYLKEIKKREEEINEIQRKINELALDDSYKAQAERAELEEELAKLKEELAEYQSDREYELRKENLNEQLEAYRKEIEAKKEAEQKKYEAERERIEKAIEDMEWYYNEMIANERYWSQVRQEIVDGELTNIQSSIQEFLDYFKSMNEETTKAIGMSWQEVLNMIDSLNMVNNDLITGNSIPNETNIINQMKANSAKWFSASPEERKRLESENQRLGKMIGAVFDPGSGRWYKNSIPLYHDGGIVGDSPKNKLTVFFDKFFNNKPNEVITKQVIGELNIPPKNIINGYKNLQNLVHAVVPASQTSQNNTSGIVVNELNLVIKNIQGGEVGAKQLFKHLDRNIRKRGW